LFNKSKPQNITFPLSNLLGQSWKSASLQLSFIKNCISTYVGKKDKSIQFTKLKSRVPTINDLQEIKDRGESAEMIEVWQSIELVERLVILSDNRGMFVKVRKVLDHPIQKLPEYLLLSLSLA
jgi:CCR4-NOT transcription complex subunit 1